MDAGLNKKTRGFEPRVFRLFHSQSLPDLQCLGALDAVEPANLVDGGAVAFGDFAQCVARFHLVIYLAARRLGTARVFWCLC